MNWRGVVFISCCFLLTVLFLSVAHYSDELAFLVDYLPASVGSDGLLWQVQTTFLSVGFAGLAIAAQLFVEAPLAVGASRGRVLDYIWAGWFVGVGLAANSAIAVETIWLSSEIGLLGVTFTWFALTIVVLVLSTVRLTRLFGHPSLLDAVVRQSLVETISSRLLEVATRYAGATKGLESLLAPTRAIGAPRGWTLRVQVSEAGRIVRAVRPKAVRQALAAMAPRATALASTEGESATEYVPPEITLDIDPGDRVRPGDIAFRVSTSQELDEMTGARVSRLLQSSIEFEPQDSVSPLEEIDRDIANLKDAIGTNLRAGAFATAERAVELLGQVVRGVWIADATPTNSSRRATYRRRDWLFRSFAEVEQDALLSARAAGIFVSSAMSRAIEAPRTGVSDYVDDCLRSFTRIWSALLHDGRPEYEPVLSRILVCVQNLAAYAFPVADERDDLQAHGVWAMVDLIKLAVDAGATKSAENAAEELAQLFRFDRKGTGRSHVLAGQLVLAGWLDYLNARDGQGAPSYVNLRALVTPQGNRAEIVLARSFAERNVAPFTQWDWWEMETGGSTRVRTVQLPDFIDRAEVGALAQTFGALPPADSQDRASEYNRFLRVLAETDRDLTPHENDLQEALQEQIAKWNESEAAGLAAEPLSETRIDVIRASLRDSLNQQTTLATLIPVTDTAPDSADTSRPILGMNLQVPREFLVDKVFNDTYADPTGFGEIIARGFTDGEDQRAIDVLRSLQTETLNPEAAVIRQSIHTLGDDAKHYVLITPFGGLDDLDDWYSSDFRRDLDAVTHIETGTLDNEAILFDRRSSLFAIRRPEDKEGLSRVEGTSIALGVFEGVDDALEPQVRVEAGEYFVVWAGDAPRIVRFVAA